jgi:hypothetical protein
MRLRSPATAAIPAAAFRERFEKEIEMKYLFAWLLGIPGGLILIWFLFNHMH